MEEEKKKKKNKKKKNKQTKTAEGVSVGVEESASVDQNHVNGIEQNHQSHVSDAADVQNDVVQKSDVDLGRHHANGIEGSSLNEAQKLYWLDREANLEEKIKQLRKEKDSHIKKEADIEMEILQLQSEKNSWLQKEASYEEKITQLVDEAATLSLKGVSLEEKIKQLERERDSWVQKENSTKETIASLNGDKIRLQAQVLELEESRNNLLQENQQLIENISGLQSQIQKLEKSSVSAHLSTESAMASENENSQREPARALVEKLLSENAELVEEVNELYVELDRRGVTTKLSSPVGSDPMVGKAKSARVAESFALGSDPIPETAERPDGARVADPMFESSERMSVSGERMDSLEDVIQSERDGGNYVNAEDAAVIPNSPETSESEEIVQIPLDENEVRDTELEASHNDEKADVPISDAPLIGAPFRLISFVARYVSGADLVNKSSVNSGR